jgi:hypothetical protein
MELDAQPRTASESRRSIAWRLRVPGLEGLVPFGALVIAE